MDLWLQLANITGPGGGALLWAFVAMIVGIVLLSAGLRRAPNNAEDYGALKAAKPRRVLVMKLLSVAGAIFGVGGFVGLLAFCFWIPDYRHSEVIETYLERSEGLVVLGDSTYDAVSRTYTAVAVDQDGQSQTVTVTWEPLERALESTDKLPDDFDPITVTRTADAPQ